MNKSLLPLLFLACWGFAQQGPKWVGKSSGMQEVPSLASRWSELIPFQDVGKEAQDGFRSGQDFSIGKDKQVKDPLIDNRHPAYGKIQTKSPELVFRAYQSTSQPTDPDLAVGPNHVVVVFNTGFIIYDKDGNALTPQLAATNIFTPPFCCDLTISYDSFADRWVMSILNGAGAGAQLAVSSGPDPVNDTWFVTPFAQVRDYQKVSLWSDMYVMMDNNNDGSSSDLYVISRDDVLAGVTNSDIQAFDLPGLVNIGVQGPQAANISGGTMPPAGNMPIVEQQDDAAAGISQDHIKVWNLTVDFDNPANSELSAPQELPVTPFVGVFDGGDILNNLTQPFGGLDISAIPSITLNQAQFRQFDTHNSLVLTYVVNTNTANELAGLRWYELRQNAAGEPWVIHQEGTHTGSDGKHAWLGSINLDRFGNIGLGYFAMGGTNDIRVSPHYTGRFLNDPLGTMSVAEQQIVEGTANAPSNRIGDYSMLDVDPVNEKEFWYIGEAFTPGRSGWIGKFQIASDFNIDVTPVAFINPVDGVLTANEQVTVRVTNLGLDEQANIPITLSVDGTQVANETIAGPLASGASIEYTFTATVDLSTPGQVYELVATTSQPGDEDAANNSTTYQVKHIASDDLGVISIDAPSTGEGLGLETVSVTIENFGFDTKSNFPVYYSVNGAPAVQETAPGPVDFGQTVTYSFSQQADLSSLGSYEITSGTSLTGDFDSSNDEITKEIINNTCSQESEQPNSTIGPNSGAVVTRTLEVTDNFLLSDVNVGVSISLATRITDLDISITSPSGTTVKLYDGDGGTDNTPSFGSAIFDDEGVESVQTASPPFNGALIPFEALSAFSGESSQGTWTLTIEDTLDSRGSRLDEWFIQLCTTETLSSIVPELDNESFSIANMGGDIYRVSLNSSKSTKDMVIRVYDMSGKLLKVYGMSKSGNRFEYDLDMSYAKSGVYIVQVGDKTENNVGRIIVK